MKKALLATCVLALAAMGIPSASASPATQIRASAFGVDLNSSLLDLGGTTSAAGPLLSRSGEAESVLPPGGPVEDDVISVGESNSILLETAGKVLADTRSETVLVPILFAGNQATGGGSGTGSGITGGGILGTLPLAGGIAGLSNGDATVQAQQIPGVPLPIPGVGGGGGVPLPIPGVGGGGGVPAVPGVGNLLDPGGLLGGLPLVGDLLGGQNPDVVGNRQPNITAPLVNGQAYAVIDNLGIANTSFANLGLAATAQQALASALLKVEGVQAEAVVVCNGNQPLYQTASRLADLNNDNLTLVDDLVGTVSDTLDTLLPGLVSIVPNETGRTADGGVFVNGLHVTIGDVSGLTGGLGGGGAVPGLQPPTGGGTVPGVGGGPLLDLVLAHAEVDGAVCAAAAAPPAIQQPTGDAGPSLPRTGGGLGLLPAVLTLGLLGAAVTGGRVALRSRRSANSSTL